jgi:hypothetical protein
MLVVAKVIPVIDDPANTETFKSSLVVFEAISEVAAVWPPNAAKLISI